MDMASPEHARNERVQYSLLLSPLLLLSLALLLINDHLLKAAYPNWFTGKLSDFSGLFMFTACLLAFLPNRPWTVAGLVTIMFAVWKSPLSGAAIHAWNQFCPRYALGRVVDYTDLFALVVVPLAVVYSQHVRRRLNPVWVRRLVAVPILGLVLLATLGTSRVTDLREPVPYHVVIFERGEAGAALSAPAVKRVIGEVAARHGLLEELSVFPERAGKYANDVLILLYSVEERRGIVRLRIFSAGHYMEAARPHADRLRHDLVKALGSKFGTVEADR